jgi:hypothetical protein
MLQIEKSMQGVQTTIIRKNQETHSGQNRTLKEKLVQELKVDMHGT